MGFDVRLLAPIATCVGILVSTYLWFLNQRRKSLGFQILKCQSLFNLKGSARKQLEIRFGGKKVEDVSLLIIRLANNGHLPISSADYQAHLSLNMPPGAEILSATVVESYPANLDDRISGTLIESTKMNGLTMHPVLLNKGDSYTLQLLVCDLKDDIKVEGHINGIESIKKISDHSIISPCLTHIGALIMAGSMLMVDPHILVPFKFEVALPYILLFLLGYVFLSAGSFFTHNKTILV
jgi:hypothetical protein